MTLAGGPWQLRTHKAKDEFQTGHGGSNFIITGLVHLRGLLVAPSPYRWGRMANRMEEVTAAGAIHSSRNSHNAAGSIDNAQSRRARNQVRIDLDGQ